MQILSVCFDIVPYVDMKELGEVLKARRVALGLTAAQIQAKGGPSPAVLSKIENGHEGNYSAMTWAGLSRALGWTSDGIMHLIEGDDPEDYVMAPANQQPGYVSPDVTGRLADHDERLARLERRLTDVIGRLEALAAEAPAEPESAPPGA